MNKLLLGTLTAASLTSGAATYAEAEHTLEVSSWVRPTHNIHAQTMPQRIEEATDGRMKTEVRMGITPPPAKMGLVLDGAVAKSIGRSQALIALPQERKSHESS